MAKIKKRGASGAAKNYVTRNQALKKLQLTLADFRRLCILKGIHPRAPRHTKRANKGSTAPATFFYAKDISFLAHEPVLRTLRAHKTFAKKLSRAVGRKEWDAAKSLQESKPVAKLDHIIRERYPTFDDSLRDLDDALSLLTLFAALPASDHVAQGLVEKCARICAEWQLYVVKAQALRKVFFSIKGVYFQAEIRGQTITWLVPYLFTQHVPQDVDFRIMSTFLELYQTLLGFVLFKLYTDLNLVYPPTIEAASDEAGAGLGALKLLEQSKEVLAPQAQDAKAGAAAAKKVSAREVKRTIRDIATSGAGAAGAEDEAEAVQDGAAPMEGVEEEADFVEAPSKDGTTSGLTTLATLDGSSGSGTANLFSAFNFYISRECPRSILEFTLRSFGAPSSHIGWDAVLGAGSAFESSKDERVTHVIIDRPPVAGQSVPKGQVHVQPQWVVDSVNAGRILPAGPYAPGQALPPHLSPFVDDEAVRARGGYVPREADGQAAAAAAEAEAEADSSDDEELEKQIDAAEVKQAAAGAAEEEDEDESRPALKALLADPLDAAGAGLEAAAELEAEAAGGEEALVSLRAAHAAASKRARKAAKAAAANKLVTADEKKRSKLTPAQAEEEEAKSMAKMLMSNKDRKLYNKLSYSQGKRGEETARLEQKRSQLDKEKKKAKKA